MRRSEDPCRDPASEMRDDHFKPDALDAPRPTPETDEIVELYETQRASVGDIIEHAESLERERDMLAEALEDLLNDGFDHRLAKIKAAQKALAILKKP